MNLLLISVLLLASPRTALERTKNDLLEIEKHIGHANLACDYDYFRQIEAEDFIFTDPSGQVTTRNQDLAGEKDCKKREGTFSLSEESVFVYGDSAVVSAISTYQTTKSDGTAVKRSNRFTDMFVRRKGQWLLVAGHSSNLKDPAK